MDRAFDCLNSKSKYGKGCREALRPHNLERFTEIFDELKEYLLSLEDANHKPLHLSRRKTFVIGFICTSQALIMLAKDLFALGIPSLTYLPTFRVSQDFIETLFSKIRRMGGHNNNPTSLGFKSALRSLLTKQAIAASKSGNCLNCDSTSGVFALEWSKRSAPVPVEEPELTPELIEHLKGLEGTSYLKNNILTYVSGFIVRGMIGKVVCDTCSQHLLSDFSGLGTSDHVYQAVSLDRFALQTIKDRGGLFSASEGVFKVVQRCESILTTYLSREFISKPNASALLLALFNRSVNEDRPISFFTHQCDIEEGKLPHCLQLTKQIASKYIEIRMKYHAKVFNRSLEKSYDRSRLNRLVIFKHQ